MHTAIRRKGTGFGTVIMLGLMVAGCHADQTLGLRRSPSEDTNLLNQARALDASRLSTLNAVSQGCVLELSATDGRAARRLALPAVLLPVRLPRLGKTTLSSRREAVAKSMMSKAVLASGEGLSMSCIVPIGVKRSDLPTLTAQNFSSPEWQRTLGWLRGAAPTTTPTKAASAEADFLRFALTGRRSRSSNGSSSLQTSERLHVAIDFSSITCPVYQSIIVGFDAASGMWIDDDGSGNCTLVDYYDLIDSEYPDGSDIETVMQYPDELGPDDSWLAGDDILDQTEGFNCNNLPCPSKETMLHDPSVLLAAKALFDLANRDPEHREWGAWIGYNSDGNIEVKPFVRGDAPNPNDPLRRTMSQLINPPDWAIGSIHAHPAALGDGSPFPSPDDIANAARYDVMVVVATRQFINVISPTTNRYLSAPWPSGWHGDYDQ